MRPRSLFLAVLIPVVGACGGAAASETTTAPAEAQMSVPATSGSIATTVAPPVDTAATASTAMPAAPTPATEVSVEIVDFTFAPAEVQVPVGGSVVWTNNDTQPHTATSAGAFDTGSLQPQTSVTVAFPTAGTFAYICSFHPFMTGTVVVG